MKIRLLPMAGFGLAGLLWAGAASAQAPSSCASILRNGLSNGDGVYTIDPDGAGGADAFDVYCDMTSAGGGWTMLYNSVGDVGGQTTAFWNIPYAQRFVVKGTPATHANFYAGVLYQYGTAYRETITDINNNTAEAYQATATGFNTNSMTFQNPARTTATDNGYSCQFASGWAAPDGDFDTYGGNCATSYSNVTQHYCACWVYNLGADADGSSPAGWGPHSHYITLNDMGLSTDGTNYSRVNRITRWARWDGGEIINPDADSDGINDDVDNCPLAANPGQSDADMDGVGDACDMCPNDAENDPDGDGICQDVDNCANTANPDQTDDNGDGFGDACVSPDADIAGTAALGLGVVIGPNAVVEGYTQIGDGSIILGTVREGAVIGSGVTEGENCVVGTNARVGDNVGLGMNVTIGSRANIGDGASLGNMVNLGAGASVGANTALGNNITIGSRATVGANSSVGDDSSIGDGAGVGQGSTLGLGVNIGANAIVGDGLEMGDNAGVSSNARVGDNATIGLGSTIGSYANVGNNLVMGENAQVASGVIMGNVITFGNNVEVRGDLGDNVQLNNDVFVGNQSSVGADSTVSAGTTIGQFVTIGLRAAIDVDAAIFSGSTLGDDADIGARAQVLFRTTLGANATVGPDSIIDEQITAGDDFTVGTNSRLWPFSTFGHNVSIGDNVLIRNNSELGDDVTVEDDAILYPRTVVGEGATIREGIEIGVDDCRANGCGGVTIGECTDVSADMDAFATSVGNCQQGLDPESAGLDCLDLLENGNVTDDGMYWIDPDGAGVDAPFQAYCDMTSSGGGWTLVLNLDTSDGHVMWWHNALWTNSTLHNDASPDLSGDYKGRGWNELPGQEMLLLVHEQGAYKGWKSFDSSNAGNTMNNWLNSGNNVPITTNGATDTYLAPDLWAGEHLVRDSNQIWINQNDAFNGYCNTNDWDRICSDTCKVGGNDGGGLGNCHDCSNGPQWRTTSEAQAGWHNWTSNSGCYAGTPHNGLGHYGTDTAYPATCNNSGASNAASWSCANGVSYDYAIFVR